MECPRSCSCTCEAGSATLLPVVVHWSIRYAFDYYKLGAIFYGLLHCVPGKRRVYHEPRHSKCRRAEYGQDCCGGFSCSFDDFMRAQKVDCGDQQQELPKGVVYNNIFESEPKALLKFKSPYP